MFGPAFIFHISYFSYLILLRRVALQQKLVFKGPSDKNVNYNLNKSKLKSY